MTLNNQHFSKLIQWERIPLNSHNQPSNLGTALQILDNLQATGYNQAALSAEQSIQSAQ